MEILRLRMLRFAAICVPGTPKFVLGMELYGGVETGRVPILDCRTLWVLLDGKVSGFEF